ncbi:MAG: peptidoglycan DD-metalloendopeptidase family protein [Pseudomonadota bacterium]
MASNSLAKKVRLLTVVATLAVAGCGLSWDGQRQNDNTRRVTTTKVPASGRYTVRTGDTLYSIAFRYGLDHKRLAAWNQLGSGALIYPGQTLRLKAPPNARQTNTRAASLPAEQKRDWRWPTTGRVVAAFDPAAQVARTGILVSGQRGQPVFAADGGEVVYSGSGLKGYGKLIIIRHDEHYLSAYGHNAALLVAEGDSVKRGERIATMGSTGAQQPRLHFEIRRLGKPIDPLPLLPRR